MSLDSANHVRVLRWINNSGGEITRNRLRRYRPRRHEWAPIAVALEELIRAGIIECYRNELEPIERGCGPVTTRYKLRQAAMV